ncbi:carbohydrate porin [Salinisphaera hydrothermalis]|uniref:carbohydrate porin n=1 Tax=Salinisphaera hydrothermalis TaxID=563188 RepID=UPI0022B31F4D|nr:carbohydrate porin [Salinisphaera hydrothermalis]
MGLVGRRQRRCDAGRHGGHVDPGTDSRGDLHPGRLQQRKWRYTTGHGGAGRRQSQRRHRRPDLGRIWGGSDDNRLYFDYLGTLGSSISNDVGDLQGLDNIEAYDTSKLYSAWYQHDFGQSGVMLRIGKQDWNALFDTLDAAGVFINSSFGLDATTAVSNVSQYPTTAVGAVARWQGDSGAYAMASVFDGTPGLPGHPAGTHIAFHAHDGVFTSAETGMTGGGDKPYKLAVGGWYQTADYHDPAGRLRDHDSGFYIIGQDRLIGGPATPKVDVFAQISGTQSDRNPLNRYLGAGVDVTGLVPERPDDVLGLAVARAHAASVYRDATPDTNRAETAIELTYQLPVNQYVTLQPDMQYIVHPGVDRSTGNATVVGLRGQLTW